MNSSSGVGAVTALSGSLRVSNSGESKPPSISKNAQNSDNEMEMDSANSTNHNIIQQKSAADSDNSRKIHDGDSDSDGYADEASTHSPIDTVPASHPLDPLFDENAKGLSKERADIFVNFDSFEGREGEDCESDVLADASSLSKDPGKESGGLRPSALDQCAQITEEYSAKSTAAAITTSSASTHAKSNRNEMSSVDETASLQSPLFAATPTTVPAGRRNSSISRRRHRHIHQMERISETRTEISNGTSEANKENAESDDLNEFVEDHFQGNMSEHTRGNLDNDGTDDFNPQRSDSHDSSATATLTPLLPTPRRRIRSLGGSPGSVGGNYSAGSGRSIGSGTRLRRSRRRLARGTRSADGERRGNDYEDGTERRQRMGRSGNTIVESLDAGMATLRRWIRVRRLSFGSEASGAGGSSSGGHSVSSMTTFRLGEEDIFALSHTGSDPRRATAAGASSTSSDPNMNIFDQNSSNGFLYYRPFEVHVHNDVDADSGFYGSDDESRTSSSILRHPLVPSTESSSVDGGASQQESRQRANSEPDRARIVDFFSSVYGSRAIDGGRSQVTSVVASSDSGDRALRQPLSRSRSSIRPTLSTSPMIIEEEMDATEQDTGLVGNQSLTAVDAQLTRLRSLSPLEYVRQSHASTLEAPDATVPSLSPLSRNATEAGLLGGLDSATASNNDPTAAATSETMNASSPRTSDPTFRARTRWMRINRRFRCLITSVAVLFSLLLFFIVITWVLLISTYILSHNKECDVPLKVYFWMVSIQLMLDIFRVDIMKWLCRYRTDSGRRIPPRVAMYNVAYLIYAMLVMRLGVRSVFITKSSCSSTAPELFYASLVFVCLSLMAWAIILLGYLIPFCFVAVLLTRNGYFPNGDIASSHGVMGGRRARIGTGRISGIVGEVFPNTCSNPAPPGCIDKLRVVLLNEFPISYQRECCICMMEYKEGEVIVATPCDHVFHKACCQEWLQLSRTCPVCRKDLPDALGMNEVEAQHISGGSESEDVMRGPNRDENRQEASIMARFLHLGEQNQSSGNTTNNHPEGIVVEFTETANERVQQQLDI